VISCDTNILFAAFDTDNPANRKARAFLDEHAADHCFVLCEQVLTELYCLVRNPTVSQPPLDAGAAAGLIATLRSNPAWRIVDVPGEARIMDAAWDIARQRGFAYRRIFDLRLALTLRHHGVTEFATGNCRDFADIGFSRVWDPLS